jgi:hypothetical protein
MADIILIEDFCALIIRLGEHSTDYKRPARCGFTAVA